MAIRTSIKYNRNSATKFDIKSRRRQPKKSWTYAKLGKQKVNTKVKKVLGIAAGIFFVMLVLGTIGVLAVVAKYSAELPNPDEPFVTEQEQTSIIYDRNNQELYQFFGDKNREIIKIEDIPLHVRWAFLAAEDIDFYEHKGIDVQAILRCGLRNLQSGNTISCGGSTITQQMIKSTVLTDEQTAERKIKEIILSLRVEQKYSKNEILQLYLNEIGFGGNVYGIKTAARVYFGKEVQDLNLAEAAMLAGLPQSPGVYSPLFASDLELARELSVQRQNYVLDQMYLKRDKINSEVDEPEFINEENIQTARDETLVYNRGKIDIEAPHFVFYVREQLKKVGYNKGEPFTENDLRRNGYRITTTLDLDMQHIAEQVLKSNVENNTVNLEGYNAGMVAIDPKNGDVLTMVGSKDYYGDPYPEGCILGKDCKFEPDVNVATALNQPGSSLKPLAYYRGLETGQIKSAEFLPDIDMTFSNGYKPKNFGNDFFGLDGNYSPRRMLLTSRNIPAVQAVEIVGVNNFLDTLERFGYTSFSNRSLFGPSTVLGAGEVTLLEHTAAYGVLANGGTLYPTNPILKIEDKEGNVIYDKSKDPDTAGKKVADERATYIITNMIGDRSYTVGPYAKKFVGNYPLAGKTGTSDDSRDTWYEGYSPNLVAGVWVGNNDNSAMKVNADGGYTALPIWYDFMSAVLPRYESTDFHRPAGVVNATVCSDSGLLANNNCPNTKTELFIQEFLPKEDDWSQKYTVCKDQPDHLARQIDIDLGYATELNLRQLKMAKEEWQPFLDEAMKGKNTIPTEECTINRNPSGNSDQPWVTISQPASGAVVSSSANPRALQVNVTAYSAYGISNLEFFLDDTKAANKITQVSTNPYQGTINIPASAADGNHVLIIRATDGKNQSATGSVNIYIGNPPAGSVTFNQPANGANINDGATLTAVFTGSNGTVSSVEFLVRDSATNQLVYTLPSTLNPDGSFSASWSASIPAGSYKVVARVNKNDGTSSITATINVTGL